MCIRYIDHINNEEMIQRFMAELISMTRKKAQMAIQRNALESIVHVLSIAYKIAIMLKYYSEYDIDRHQNNSADKQSKSNGGEQNGENKEQSEEDYDFSQALKNFDLTDYTKVLRDLIIWIYLSKIIEWFFVLNFSKLFFLLCRTDQALSDAHQQPHCAGAAGARGAGLFGDERPKVHPPLGLH